MKAIPWRVQVGVVVAAYASVLGIAAVLIFIRWQQYMKHPEDVQASGGMYAFGDTMLAMFIACMLFAATLVLIVVIRNAEGAYTRLAQILFGISLTAPLSVGLMAIPAVEQSDSVFAFACMYRVETSPVFIVGFVISRLAARFKPGKRWTLYAVGVEVATLVVCVAGLFLPRPR